MAENSGRRAFSDREVEQAIVALKKGAHLLRFGRRGKPQFCPFRLSTDEKSLIWYSGEKRKQLKLNDVSKVVLGQQTVNFLHQGQAEKEPQSFSLIYENGQHSLDLICKDKEQAESWYLGLTALVLSSHYTRQLTNLKSSTEVHSCVNSPAYTMTKHKLGSLQGSAKLPKVRNLYGSPARSVRSMLFSERMLDSSNEYCSPRQRTFSDVQSYLDKILPRLSHFVSDGEKNIRYSNLSKEERIVSTFKLYSSERGSPTLHTNEGLKDVFIWGKRAGGLLSGDSKSLLNNSLEVDSAFPKLLESTCMLDVQEISCGEKHVALVTKQGEVFCWGDGNDGKLGHKMNMDVLCPTVVESLTGIYIQSVACAAQWTCAVASSGELYVWGDSNGYLIPGETSIKSQWFPHRICGPLDGIGIARISCGDWHTAIISTSGQLFTYGIGTFGVLGHGDAQSISQPKEVESLKGSKVKSIACGPWHTAAIVEIPENHLKAIAVGAKLFTWGDTDKGKLGHADKERKLVPTCVASLVDHDFIQVSCGTSSTVALTADGIVFTMGIFTNGQLGNPHASEVSTVKVEGLLKNQCVKEVSTGSFHVAVVTTKGKVYTWGKGENGQLGLGDNKDRSSPALVEALEDKYADSVACGSNFTVVSCLHRIFSSRDQSVCSGCRMMFGFSRKKHNCYNCGFMFCNSCSNRKATNAALAPNTSKKYRVCKSCFNQLERITDLRMSTVISTPRPLMTAKQLSDYKKEQTFYTRLKEPLLKSALVFEEVKLAEKAESIQENKDRYLCSPLTLPNRRWGQVSCPSLFAEYARWNSKKNPFSREEPFHDDHACKYESESIILGSLNLKQEPIKIDKMLIEELRRLQAEAVTLIQQCQIKSQKLQNCKQKLEETWSLAKHEAAKCKAAKDVIKILANQMTTISEKLSFRGQIKNSNSILDSSSTTHPVNSNSLRFGDEIMISCISQRPVDVPQIPDEKLELIANLKHPRTISPTDKTVAGFDTIKCTIEATEDEYSSITHPVNSNSLRFGDEIMISCISQRPVDVPQIPDEKLELIANLKHPRTISPTDKTVAGFDTIKCTIEATEDEYTEQDEVGVYITFITMPNGQRGLKRLKFSRKQFAEKEAEKWWLENQRRIYTKYGIKHMAR